MVQPEVGGRYETNPPEGRQEGTIISLEAPRKITFTWPLSQEESLVETTVSYELAPKGPDTVVHVTHRAPKILPKDWNATWRRALESLKEYLEAQEPSEASPGSAQGRS